MSAAAASEASSRALRRLWLLGPVLVLAGCGSLPGGSPGAAEGSSDGSGVEWGDHEPVAVLTEPQEREKGARANPLRPGESLGFVFGVDTVPTWTMEGIGYPLLLRALDGDGKVIDSTPMQPGVCCYSLNVAASVYVEVRPRGFARSTGSPGVRNGRETN